MAFDAQQVIFEIEKIIVFYIDSVIKLNKPSAENGEDNAQSIPVSPSSSNSLQTTTFMLKQFGVSAYSQANYAYSRLMHSGEIKALKKELVNLQVLVSPETSDDWARHLIDLGETSLHSQFSWQYKRLLHGIRYIILDALLQQENTASYDALVLKIQHDLDLQRQNVTTLKKNNADKKVLKSAQAAVFKSMRALESLGVVPEQLNMPVMNKEVHRSGMLLQRNHVYCSFSSTNRDNQILPPELEDRFHEAYRRCEKEYSARVGIKGPPPEYTYLKNLGEEDGFLTDIVIPPDAPDDACQDKEKQASPVLSPSR